MKYVFGILFLMLIIMLVYCITNKKQMSILSCANEKLREKCEKQRCDNNKMREKLKQYEYIGETLKVFHHYNLLKVIENKNSDIYFVMENLRGKHLEILFSGLQHEGVTSCPRLLATVEDSYIQLDDIFAIDDDCGNGSILLNVLFEKAKKLDIKIIKGDLSDVDKHNFNKLEYFYQKNGFTVHFDKGRCKGKIEKKID